MNDGQNAKQQIVEQIRASSNILVTVSNNSSVDELSAALGLTVMLNNLKKHATAVVSGEIPPAIEFLEPGKTFENTVDSLRDFIIALDKEKADHLRYKVEGDVVKIFITPYRTTIDENDLEFSQGDYNVELVLALGVDSQENLDSALSAHGRILHDATVATLSCGDKHSRLGSIDWYESSASSISEMLVSLSEALKDDEPLLDEQTATALLTGIVAATDRFSNNKTSSKVMTMAAQLMAAGANQQLIAAKLEEAHEISRGEETTNAENSDGSTDLSEDKSSKVNKKSSKNTETKAGKKNDETQANGTLAISHEKEGTVDEVARQTAEENSAAAAEKAETMLDTQLASVAPAKVSNLSVTDLKKDLQAASNEVDQSAAQLSTSNDIDQPSLGGVLNATTEEAAVDKKREENANQNHTILTHNQGQLSNQPVAPIFAAPPINGVNPALASDAGLPPLPEVNSVKNDTVADALPTLQSSPSQTLADLDMANRNQASDARSAIDAALAEGPAQPHPSTIPLGNGGTPTPQLPVTPVDAPLAMPNLPPLPNFSTLPPPPPVFDTSVSDAANDNLLPPLPEQPLGAAFPDTSVPPQGPVSNDPTQFQIPGQN